MVTMSLATPAIVRGVTRHKRRRPFPHGLKFGTYLWLIDLSEPQPRSLTARFRAADHFDGNAIDLRAAALGFAETAGEQMHAGDRLLMLAAPWSLGHVFNPLSVFWCLTEQGEIRWAILEIHNTYGQRHAHLLRPDAQGKATVAKVFYVSPFFTIDGDYEVTLRLNQEQALVVVNLRQAGELVFGASFSGKPAPATLGARARAVLRTPLVNQQTTLRIRVHGIYLWLRRLPVVPRPKPEVPAGVR